MRVTCFGPGRKTDSYKQMYDVGKLLAEAKPIVTVVTGGYGGSGMEAPACGAKDGNPESERIGYLYRPDAHQNPFIGRTVDCRAMAEVIANTSSTADFDAKLLSYLIRLAGLLNSDAFIFAVDGGLGTLLEFVAVLNSSVKDFWSTKRIVLLTGVTDDDRQQEICSLLKWGNLEERERASICITSSPEEAVRWILAPSLSKRKRTVMTVWTTA